MSTRVGRAELAAARTVLEQERDELDELKRTYDRSFVLSESESEEKVKKPRLSQLIPFTEVSKVQSSPWGLWIGYQLSLSQPQTLTALKVQSSAASHTLLLNGQETALTETAEKKWKILTLRRPQMLKPQTPVKVLLRGHGRQQHRSFSYHASPAAG